MAASLETHWLQALIAALQGGQLALLLRAVSGRGWFGGSRPQPSEEAALASLPAGAAASARVEDSLPPVLAADALVAPATAVADDVETEREDMAAAIAVADGVTVRNVNISKLQRNLEEHNAIL